MRGSCDFTGSFRATPETRVPLAQVRRQMQRYGNLAGNSGVVAYALGEQSLRVRFANSSRVYEYSHASAGREHVEAMTRLALAGRGLSTYISRHVADAYVR